MTELIVLGLLSHKHPLTSYDIKKAMEQSTQMFMTTSFGSIHPCLKKMVTEEWVTQETKYELKRKKIFYTITTAGQAAFEKLIKEDLGPDKLKLGILLKMFYFNYLTEEEQTSHIDTYIEIQRKTIQKLEEVKEHAFDNMCKYKLTVESYPPAKYQLDAIDFGLAYEEFLINWFEDYKGKLRERKEHENSI